MKAFGILFVAGVVLAASQLVFAQPNCFMIITDQTFTDSCGGANPLPDGPTICVFNDIDRNGPDSDDPLLDAPEINYSCFILNGGSLGSPGMFMMVTPICCNWGTEPLPTLYVRICHERGHWVSQGFTLIEGTSEYYLNHWFCLNGPCDVASPPPQVTGVWATDSLYSDVVLVYWTDVDNELGYRIYCDSVLIAETYPNATVGQAPCTDFNRHLYQVSAFNDYDESELSLADTGSCRALDLSNNEIAALPHVLSLHQNYPNPFNPQTTIAFDVPHAAEVSLRVFNTAGQQMAVLYNGWVNAGRHTVQFDGQALPSGVYFGQLQSGEYATQIKMLLLK